MAIHAVYNNNRPSFHKFDVQNRYYLSSTPQISLRPWYNSNAMKELIEMLKNKLAVLLAEHKLHQADLARMTGIRRATINELYHDALDRISLADLERILVALDVHINEFFIEDPDVSKETLGINTVYGSSTKAKK